MKNPLTSLADDIAATKRIIALQSGLESKTFTGISLRVMIA